jgi:hypothetical protein
LCRAGAVDRHESAGFLIPSIGNEDTCIHQLCQRWRRGTGLRRIILELARRCEQDASAALPVFVPLGQWIKSEKDAVAGLMAYVGRQLGELADCYESLRLFCMRIAVSAD